MGILLYNNIDGEGVFEWPDGKKYNGQFKCNKRDGKGSFYWPNGKIYIGFWKDGLQNGEGKLYIPKIRDWVKGIWKDGKKVDN